MVSILKKLILVLLFSITWNAATQVDGKLLLALQKLSNSEMQAAEQVKSGDLIYNTDETEVYVYTGTHWSPLIKEVVGRWENTDTTTDLLKSDGSLVKVPIFGEHNIKSTNAFETLSETEIKIKQSGRYVLGVNLYIISDRSTERSSVELRAYAGNNAVSAVSQHGYNRGIGGANRSSYHLNDIITLQAGDTLSLQTKRLSSTPDDKDDLNLSGVGNSSIILLKLYDL